MAAVNNKCGEKLEQLDSVDIVDYQTERRKTVLTVVVLAVWVCFVLAVVSRSTQVALTDAGQSLEYAGPLLFVIIVSVIFLVIFCLPNRLKGEEENVYRPVAVEQ